MRERFLKKNMNASFLHQKMEIIRIKRIANIDFFDCNQYSIHVFR